MKSISAWLQYSAEPYANRVIDNELWNISFPSWQADYSHVKNSKLPRFHYCHILLSAMFNLVSYNNILWMIYMAHLNRFSLYISWHTPQWQVWKHVCFIHFVTHRLNGKSENRFTLSISLHTDSILLYTTLAMWQTISVYHSEYKPLSHNKASYLSSTPNPLPNPLPSYVIFWHGHLFSFLVFAIEKRKPLWSLWNQLVYFVHY